MIVAFGDSITDGTASTLNGDDRWPDVFARRLHAVAGNRYVVVNEGIGGNEVVGPPDQLRVSPSDLQTPEGCRPVRSPIGASVWTIGVEAGQRVEAGQKLLVLEAMKTEIAVVAPSAGTVERLHCATGSLVSSGQILLAFRPEAFV